MNPPSSPKYRHIPASLLIAWMEEAYRQSDELVRQKVVITKNLSAMRQTLADIHAEIQRRAEVSWRNRLRLGLYPIPPMVSTSSTTPVTPAPVPPPPPPHHAAASIPVKEQGDKQGRAEPHIDKPRNCGECANFRLTCAEEKRGYCSYIDESAWSFMPVRGCPRFDPIPTSTKTPEEAVAALDSLATPAEMEICDVRR